MQCFIQTKATAGIRLSLEAVNARTRNRLAAESAAFRLSLAVLKNCGVRQSLIRSSTAAVAVHHQQRFFSSGGRRNDGDKSSNARFELYGLPFSVSPLQAEEKFTKWAYNEQGLQYLIRSHTVTAAYCPVWSFDVNVRFVIRDKKTGRARLDWKPSLFSAYGNQSVVHIPGLSTYAGFDYPRSLLNPIHNTTLVFLGDKTVPFGKWMLRHLKGPKGEAIPINPDAWNTTRAKAFSILRQELTAVAELEGQEVQVQTEVVRAKRVYLPTYCIDYNVLGVDYQAFVSGADAGAGVSGTSHQVWETSTQEASQGLQGFLSQAMSTAQRTARAVGGQRTLLILSTIVRLFGQVLGRLLIRLPWIAALVGGFVGFRKFVQPYFGSRWTSAQWERQREHEASMDDEQYDHEDDFVDSGGAQRFYQANRGRILRHFTGGDAQHQTGNYDWQADWQEWARQTYYQQQQSQYQQRQQQQQQQQQTYGYQQQQQQQQQQRVQQQKRKPDFQWEKGFDPDDPYSVLKIPRGSTKQQVSAAFRREMLKYHPDTQTNASEAEKLRATERSKLISEAYRKIKSEMK